MLLAIARAPDPPEHPTGILGSVPIEAHATVGRVLSAFEDHGIVTSSKEGRRKVYSLDKAGLKAAIYDVEKQREIDELCEELVAGNSQ